jgi:hypothetical protein
MTKATKATKAGGAVEVRCACGVCVLESEASIVDKRDARLGLREVHYFDECAKWGKGSSGTRSVIARRGRSEFHPEPGRAPAAKAPEVRVWQGPGDFKRPLSLSRPCECGCDHRGDATLVGYLSGGNGVDGGVTLALYDEAQYQALAAVLRASGVRGVAK